MKIVVAGLILSCLAITLNSQECNCRAPERSATTRTGYFDEIVVEDKNLYKALHGVVHLPNDERPMEDALVELFTYPESKSKMQRRIRACITGEDGRFCFRSVSKGKYELRVSKEGGFEITHVYVVVDPKNSNSTNGEMSIIIYVGK